jgi:hypothetical protein
VSSGLGIIALRGVDGGADCGCSGMGADAAVPNPVLTPIPTSTKVFWALAIGAVGLIFWATLQPPKRRLVS